ncbi:LARGE xylosyl and glucuronyltransferase 2 [Taenia crassiceps]|uniref:LARGE xylosyl and glucuronyltransferase 2 n=1 Tax=Taenia crassiceps TaxID=6207 RepID=A0ABR4QPP2_9CEST
MFVTAVCLVLSVSSIAIWMHTTSLVTLCTMDHPFKNENLDGNYDSGKANASVTVIDVALVVGGGSASRKVPVLVKSIFYHRLLQRHCNELLPKFRFHIICSTNACKSLSVLFETWRISALVKVYFYSIANFLSLVNWIPNAHYSGDYGLMKLVISDVLPCTIKKVILLDLDTLVEGNLISIWKSAETFEKEEIIGLVENQSDWYLKEHGTSSWPALGRGYNTGVVLMDLQKMREVGWNWHWKNVAQNLLRNTSHTSLADQDVVNAALYFNSTRVHRLPCAWNLQLGDNANYSHCLFNDRSPTTTEASTQNRQRDTVKACSLFHMEMRLQRRVFPHFYEIISNTTESVTLVSQFTIDRLHRLEEIAANWEGPMSLAVYITDREAALITEYLDSSIFFTSRENIGIHLVFQEGSYYPINALRNTAMKYADTAYVFIVDFDFVPKPHLHTYFQRTLASVGKIEKVAYIVPAFETFYTQLEFPATKRHLLQNIASGVVKPFRIDVWQAGHFATNYSHWYKAEMPYEVKWDADFEPYVLIRRGHEQFDERFVGFGWNKVSFFMLLDALDFKFVVLPNAFIIHLPHAPSVESNRFRHSHSLRQCLEDFKVKYIKDLAIRFGVKSLNSQNHCALLDPIPKAQIIRLVHILRDLENGVSLGESLRYNNEVEKISPTEDLNKETDEVVERKKTVMNEQYEINLIRPDDSNFRYDLPVDFPEQRETSEWDSDMSDF